MIVGFFLDIIYTFVAFFVNLLPMTAYPQSLADSIRTAWYYINALSFLLPMSTILTVLVLAMSFHVAVLLWRLAHLIGGYIRGR